jgi:molybdopterin-guanine dinucleotide biosynthesis protein A
LAAQAAQPGAAWLVVACDLPLVDEGAVRQLLAGRRPDKEATAFYSAVMDGPDPLLAIWEGRGLARLAEASAQAATGPFAFLKKAELELLLPESSGILANANTPEDRERVLSRLRQRG